MKVSNHQLRKIIREEFSRPVRVYTDDELMNEGLLDFIGGLFGKMTGFFKDLSGGTQDAASKTSSDAESSGNSAIAKAAKTAGREDVGGVEDLDLDDKKDQALYFGAIAPSQLAKAEEALAELGKADAVKSWVPKSDSEEDTDAWEKENGDAATSIWVAWGTVLGSLQYLGDNGISAAADAAKEGAAQEGANPAEAIQGLISALDTLGTVWKYAEEMADDAKGAGVMSAWGQVASKAKEIEKKIAASSKEEMKDAGVKEWVNLRKSIRSLVLVERDDRNTISFTKKQLSTLIRESMEIDLEIGDVILTGKFKNKRTTVKEVGVDDNGQPTINGRPMLKFRIEKKMPEEKWSSKTKELHAKANLKEANMKITRNGLRKIIREAVLQEQTIQFVHPDVDNATFENKLANYAHAGDIQGALADADINTKNLDLDLDDFRGNMKYIEHPDFDKQKTKEFIRDLEDAWYDEILKKGQQALASSPNKAELEAIGGGLHTVLDTDLPYITYQPRRKGGKVVAIMIEDNEGPKGFPMGNMSTVLRDDSVRGYGTTLDKIIAVLDNGGANLRKKQKPVKYTPPTYD